MQTQRKLSNLELAFLYLLLFNISEGSLGKEFSDPIDWLLIENGQPPSETWISDEDGGPMNASKGVYDAYNTMCDEIPFETVGAKDAPFNKYLNAMDVYLTGKPSDNHIQLTLKSIK
jgi:hypothetical protein